MSKSKLSRGAVLALALGAVALLSCSTASGRSPDPTRSRAKSTGNAAKRPAKDIFGYGNTFAQKLRGIGQIDAGQFDRRYRSKARYLPKIGWNPTTAKFWSKFQAQGSGFQVNAKELRKFRSRGLVVSERLGGKSFAEVYYKIFVRDLPVFISADSILHAWHRSYDAVLEELESTYLMKSLDQILAGMAAGLLAARRAYGQGELRKSVADADYFIAVARSLLAGKQVGSKLGTDPKVTRTLAAVAAKKMQRFKLFGAPRVMDFSQFKPRGHYEKSALLRRYFKAMMWLGRIDLRVLGGNRGVDYRRQLGSAVVLHDLLRRAGKFRQWAELDRMIQTFIGPNDSMTFAQLAVLLKAAGIRSPAQVTSLAALTRLQRKVARSKLGHQRIRSHYFESTPYGPDQVVLPRSFLVMGQKFTMDSWATSKVVADDIRWNRMKIQRRMPSALDVAYGVFANDHVVPLLVARMKNKRGVRFRDGLPYAHNLAAVRQTIDAQQPKAWTQNLYAHWLATLRTLSAPTTDKKFPQAMRTKSWAMKTLNTQLASWAQLRHDTILYVKQSYTSGASCYYPAGFVEPRIRFWRRFHRMARAAAKLLGGTPYPASLKALQAKHAAFFTRFAAHLKLLGDIAQKQLAQKPLTAAETRILKDVVQISHGSGFTRYNGWYPKLFYSGPTDSGKYDALVADVHTDVPAPVLGDPGGVLHQGVGTVDLMLVAIDNGSDRVVYAGPTLSHYEFATEKVVRKSDKDWKQMIRTGRTPSRPEWTRSYLVPR